MDYLERMVALCEREGITLILMKAPTNSWRYWWYDEWDERRPNSGSHRSVRGGSWHQTATSWRVSYRKPYAPNYRGISIGFRVVLEKE